MNYRVNEPYFWWRKDWYLYMRGIQETIPAVNFALSIARYGFYGEEPTRIDGELLEYFNREVRPDLDKQRKRMKTREGRR